MQLSSEETLTLQLRRRSFQLALADLRVQGALIVTTQCFAVCPCCAYPTLQCRNGYNDCKLCSWEDDGQDDADADEVRGGPNSDYSLTEARRNFIDGRTKYRNSDAGYSREAKTLTQRNQIIAAYEALLPDVHPWSFIAALPQIGALETSLHEQQYGKRNVLKWRAAAQSESRRADREWEIWRAVAIGTLPRQGWWLPSIENHEQRRVQSIARRSTELVEERLGSAAPVVTHRGRNYCCWSLDERSAWLTHHTEGKIGLSLDPYVEGRREPIFSMDDELTPDKMAQYLVEYFGEAADSPA
jgi:hypothetical protein